jgi:hypothetical protein
MRQRIVSAGAAAVLVLGAGGLAPSAVGADDSRAADPALRAGPVPTTLSVTRLPGDDRYAEVDVAPNGRVALVVSESRTVKVRLAPGKPRVLGASANVSGVSADIHPSGRFAYVLGRLGSPLQVVSIARGKPRLVRTMMRGISFSDLVVSPDGRWLYLKNGSSDFYGHRGLYVISLARPGRPVRVRHIERSDEYGGSMAITPNGKRVITTNSSGSANFLHRYDVSKQRKAKKLGGKKMPLEVDEIAMAPGGGSVYVSGSVPGSGSAELEVAKVRTSNLAVQKVLGPIGGISGANNLAVTPDGRYLLEEGWAPGTDAGFHVFGTSPFRRLSAWDGLGPSADGLGMSYAGPTKGRFYQAVLDDGTGERHLVASRLAPG